MKADPFNDFFVEQCSIYDNGSTLPASYIRPGQTLDFIDIDDHKILKAIRNLNPNKAHGCDDISIRMLKICDDSIVLPLRHIFTKCLEFQTFPTLWKRADILPVHKKQSRQLIKNYRPISLLPICEKIFEKLIFDYIYEHLCNNRLITPNQSGFRPSDSTINQLLSITHNIYEGFEMEPSRETRAVFLDISKAFDKVWHESLLFKLKRNGIGRTLLELIRNYLNDRYQRVVLNGKSSSWKEITAGVPQGSVLGPLFFLIYINDLCDDLSCEVKLFADDTSLFTMVFNENISAQNLNSDLRKIQEWAFQWKM